MRQILTLIFLSVLSMSSFAQDLSCLNKLLHFDRYSGLHHLTKEEWNDGRDVLDGANILAVLSALTDGKLMCHTGELEVKLTPVCSQLIANIPQSNVCHVYTNLGYFFISKDGGKNVNFIFSKDKRFTPPL